MTTPRKLAALPDGSPYPPYWEKAVLAHYLRMLGATQRETAKAVGRGVRSIRRWEADPVVWPAARTEAEKRWLADVIDASRATLLRSIREGAGELALKVLERSLAELAPPQQRLKVHHDSGPGLSGLLTAFEDDDADLN